jgi:hypothetical protein
VILGPYIPPENYGPAPPPPHPAQPGLLLLTVALIVLVVFIAREIALRRGSERIVDELTIRWVPAEAAEMMAEADAEELTFGRDD